MNVKIFVLVVAFAIATGTATSVYYIGTVKSSNSEEFNNQNTTNTTNQHEFRILNYSYYYLEDEYSSRVETYLRFTLSQGLLLDDFILMYYHNEEVGKWIITPAQAYEKNIILPLGTLTNLNGPYEFRIMRGDKIVYDDNLTFITNPDIQIFISKVTLYPVNKTIAYIDSINLTINTSTPVYIDELSVDFSNIEGSYEFENPIYFTSERKISLYFRNDTCVMSTPPIKKGQYVINITISYPIFLSGYRKIGFQSNLSINITCPDVKIKNISISNDSFDEPIIRIILTNTSICPLEIDTYLNKEKIRSAYLSKGNEVDIVFPQYYNFASGNYTFVLKDYYGNVIDKRSILLNSAGTVYAHSEDTYNYSGNLTNIYSSTVTLKNTGNTVIYITHYNCTIFYQGNHTMVGYDYSEWAYLVLSPGENGNISVYPNINVPRNQTYIFDLVVWGDNSDVKLSFQYIVKT